MVEVGDDVLVQTDSTEAIAALTGQRLRYESFTLELGEVRGHVNHLIQEHDLRVTYRHVKGHSGRSEARYRANEHCDERAKLHMRRARRRLREQRKEDERAERAAQVAHNLRTTERNHERQEGTHGLVPQD